MSEHQTREGVVAVVRRDGRYLMIRRAAGILAGGAWCFVGGGIEPSETEQQAVAREFGEEMGGRVTPIRKVWEWRRPDGRLRLHWWLCRLEAAPLQPNPEEVQDHGWFSLDELLALPELLESNREFATTVGPLLVQDPS